jgi:hypothetical protein
MTQHLVFRFEGVVTQTLYDVVLGEAEERSRPLDPAERLALRELGAQVRAGRIDWAAYCSRTAALTEYSRDGGSLSDLILGRLCVGPGVSQFLAEVSVRFTPWLFCEVPEEVLAPTILRLRLDRFFEKDRWLFSSAACNAERVGSLTERLQRITGASLGELLWIDDRAAVAAAVLRAGLNAVAYVDPFRLRRNLVLRGLLK